MAITEGLKNFGQSPSTQDENQYLEPFKSWPLFTPINSAIPDINMIKTKEYVYQKSYFPI